MNFDEINRITIIPRKADPDGVAASADWRPGEDLIIPTAGNYGAAKERIESQT